MACNSIWDALSPPNRLWAPASSRCAPNQVTQQLALTSRFSLIAQNFNAFSSRPESKRPGIIFLQEVTSDVRTSILGNPKVHEAFLVTDAEDQTSFEGVAFANMTLLSSKRFAFDLELQKEDGVKRGEKFMLGPQVWGCALSVDIIPPSTPSTPTTTLPSRQRSSQFSWDTLPYCAEQMEILANLLRELGCGGGLIVGDFNAISPEDHALLDKNGPVDAWVALHGKKGLDGATWGVGVERHDGLRPGRLDKVAMSGVDAKDMEILRPGLSEVPKPSEDPTISPAAVTITG
ncbi:hypothetical protein BDR05DRAFT_978376 [Suillus weaverae]|nr:hypothetical protein BDR05DRAFT_978376 [Suillus weaverae]